MTNPGDDPSKKPAQHAQQLAPRQIFSRIPARPTYSIGQILLFVSLVLSASASFQGASRACAVFFPYLPVPDGVKSPSWGSGRLWVLRLGYYKLMRPTPHSGDWIWLADHTMQCGPERCLVILGGRAMSLASPRRSLTHAAVEPIMLRPVTKSNGTVVYEQLEEAIAQTGIPRQIVSDGGPDLRKGIRLVCQAHTETIRTYDIKHATARLLQRHLEADEAWSIFRQSAALTKRQVQQTRLAFVAPRNQRSKAR